MALDNCTAEEKAALRIGAEDGQETGTASE
jgi:hypothetical protein